MKAGTFDLPRITAPAGAQPRDRRGIGSRHALAVGPAPAVERRPATSKESLTVTGSPSSGRAVPSRSRRSDSAAAAAPPPAAATTRVHGRVDGRDPGQRRLEELAGADLPLIEAAPEVGGGGEEVDRHAALLAAPPRPGEARAGRGAPEAASLP